MQVPKRNAAECETHSARILGRAGWRAKQAPCCSGSQVRSQVLDRVVARASHRQPCSRLPPRHALGPACARCNPRTVHSLGGGVAHEWPLQCWRPQRASTGKSTTRCILKPAAASRCCLSSDVVSHRTSSALHVLASDAFKATEHDTASNPRSAGPWGGMRRADGLHEKGGRVASLRAARGSEQGGHRGSIAVRNR